MDRKERRETVERHGRTAISRSNQGYWGQHSVRSDLDAAEVTLIEGLSEEQFKAYVEARVALANEFALKFK